MGEALSAVYYLAGEWAWRRDVLSALGAGREELDRRDEMLFPEAEPRVTRGAARAAEIEAFLAGMDGELG